MLTNFTDKYIVDSTPPSSIAEMVIATTVSARPNPASLRFMQPPTQDSSPL